MTDVNGVDERIAHQAANETYHAIGGQHARGRKTVAAGCCAFDVIHCLDEIIDTEWNRCHQYHAQKFKSAEYMTDCRQRQRKTEARERTAQIGKTHAAEVES